MSSARTPPGAVSLSGCQLASEECCRQLIYHLVTLLRALPLTSLLFTSMWVLSHQPAQAFRWLHHALKSVYDHICLEREHNVRFERLTQVYCKSFGVLAITAIPIITKWQVIWVLSKPPGSVFENKGEWGELCKLSRRATCGWTMTDCIGLTHRFTVQWGIIHNISDGLDSLL